MRAALGRLDPVSAAADDSSLSFRDDEPRKSCAHPLCACAAEPGKEFCSDECRNTPVPTGTCRCQHLQFRKSSVR